MLGIANGVKDVCSLNSKKDCSCIALYILLNNTEDNWLLGVKSIYLLRIYWENNKRTRSPIQIDSFKSFGFFLFLFQ